MAESATEISIDAAVHRRLAIDLFNHTWELIDTAERTREETDRMIHAAHASRYHWGVVGQPVNAARGEWQISRVYALLGRAEPSLYHAMRCREICEENGIGDFDIAYAYEALARAYAAAGDPDACTRHRAQARKLSAGIAEDDDRELLLKDLQTGPWFGVI